MDEPPVAPVTVTLPMSTRTLKAETRVCTSACLLGYVVDDSGVIALVHQAPNPALGGNTVLMSLSLADNEIVMCVRYHHTGRFA